MKKKYITGIILLFSVTMLFACGKAQSKNTETTPKDTQVNIEDTQDTQDIIQNNEYKEYGEVIAISDMEDGVYTVEFYTDSSMFHINEALNNQAKLVVTDKTGVLHITLESKKILNLYPGFASEVAEGKEKALEPTEDEVTYDDGTTSVVYGFDVPVEYINKEFDLALVGTKGNWYDHKVYITNPIKAE